MRPFDGRTVLVGVSGGIAAYKAAELVSRLAQAGANVRVVMTAHATEFVTPITFQALSGNPVHTRTFAAPETYGMGHLSLTESAAALVVAPATANLLAKAAHGLADDLLSTTITAVTCPILFAPAMNAAMWANPLVQRNVATLREVGHRFVGPGTGWLACRASGAGRMSEPAEIVAALAPLLETVQDLAGRRVLITAGPTREYLDEVRYLTNPSTGKQGYALAAAAASRGAEVTLISGPTTLAAPAGVERVEVTTAAEMRDAVLDRGEVADLIVGVAAVGDYAPAERLAGKPSKQAELNLKLVRTPDIIAAVSERRRPGQIVVGFAAESDDLLARAADKLRRKQLDLIVANDVSRPDRGFAVETNQVTLLYPDGRREDLPAGTKLAVAHQILTAAVGLWG